jgi:hypothetical protein
MATAPGTAADFADAAAATGAGAIDGAADGIREALSVGTLSEGAVRGIGAELTEAAPETPGTPASVTTPMRVWAETDRAAKRAAKTVKGILL